MTLQTSDERCQGTAVNVCASLLGLAIVALALAASHQMAGRAPSLSAAVGPRVAIAGVLAQLLLGMVLITGLRRWPAYLAAVWLGTWASLGLMVDTGGQGFVSVLALARWAALSLTVPLALTCIAVARACARLSSARWSVRRKAVLAIAGWSALALPCAWDILARTGETSPPEHEPPGMASLIRGLDAVHDFGFVERQSTHTRSFALHNDSDVPLTVQRVVAECACIRVKDRPSVIEPGEHGLINLDLVAPRQPVVYDENVLILTSDPSRPRIRLRILARVGIPLQVVPTAVEFASVRGGFDSSEIAIRNHSPDPIKLLYATASLSGVAIEIPREPVPPGSELRLRVSARPGGTTRHQQGTIEIRTDSRHQALISVPVSLRIGKD